PARAARGDEGADDADHRPPAVDDRARGRARRAGARTGGGARDARRTARAELRVPRDLRARAARAAVHGRGGGARVTAAARLWRRRCTSATPASPTRALFLDRLVAIGAGGGFPEFTRQPNMRAAAGVAP